MEPLASVTRTVFSELISKRLGEARPRELNILLEKAKFYQIEFDSSLHVRRKAASVG